MDEEKYQKELFEFEKPKRVFPRLSDIFPKADFDNRVAITLTMERLVFIAIGFLMLIVVVYALGVESGKRITDKISSETRISLVKPTRVLADTKAAARPAAPNIVPRLPAASPRGERREAGKAYTIHAASFSRRDYALEAMNRLKVAGFDAFLTQSGNIYRLYAGSYQSSGGAEKDLSKMRRMYKDAYIKAK
jgi:hypothetical protein